MAYRRSLTLVAEIMPDRCAPEYERILVGMGGALRLTRAGLPPAGPRQLRLAHPLLPAPLHRHMGATTGRCAGPHVALTEC